MPVTAAAGPAGGPSRAALARLIDHTLLRPEATPADVSRLCAEACRHGFATVCVNPAYVTAAAAHVAGTEVGVCSVVGFPLGATCTAIKAAEARRAVEDGACELDMVMAIGRLRAGDAAYVHEDIRAVTRAAGERLVKVILETALLASHEIEEACRIAVAAGAGFVKSSTGFGPAGASVGAIALMRRVVGPGIGVKAAGGIRDAATARAMVAAGASRLGTSSALAILAA